MLLSRQQQPEAVLSSSCAAAGVVMEAFTDFVVGHGELWSALLFAATLRRQARTAASLLCSAWRLPPATLLTRC